LRKKAIVIGLDGLEPTIVEAMVERGDLPNLARIRQLGWYSRLRTTYPAQTPVAWSSFATGTNPVGTEFSTSFRAIPQPICRTLP